MRKFKPLVIRSGVLCGVMVAGGWLSLLLTGTSEGVALVWLPAGFALISLTYFDWRLWPGIAIGSFTTNLLFGLPLDTALGIAFGSTLGALTGAYALHLAGFNKQQYESIVNVFKFNGIGVLTSALVSAALGVSALNLTGIIPAEAFWGAFSRWWVGDATGIVVIAPFALIYQSYA